MSGPVERWLETFMCQQYADRLAAYGFKTLNSVCQLQIHQLQNIGVAQEHCELIMENVHVLRQTLLAGHNKAVNVQEQSAGNGVQPVASAALRSVARNHAHLSRDAMNNYTEDMTGGQTNYSRMPQMQGYQQQEQQQMMAVSPNRQSYMEHQNNMMMSPEAAYPPSHGSMYPQHGQNQQFPRQQYPVPFQNTSYRSPGNMKHSAGPMYNQPGPLRHNQSAQNPQQVADNILQMASSTYHSPSIHVPLTNNRSAPYQVQRSSHYIIQTYDNASSHPQHQMHHSQFSQPCTSPHPPKVCTSPVSPICMQSPVSHHSGHSLSNSSPGSMHSPVSASLKSPSPVIKSPCGMTSPVDSSSQQMRSPHSGVGQFLDSTCPSNQSIPSPSQQFFSHTNCQMQVSSQRSPSSQYSHPQQQPMLMDLSGNPESFYGLPSHNEELRNPPNRRQHIGPYECSPSKQSYISDNEVNLTSSENIGSSNPLQSLQKLVMLSETQVVDPKSVVSDGCLPSPSCDNSDGNRTCDIDSVPPASTSRCTDGFHCGDDSLPSQPGSPKSCHTSDAEHCQDTGANDILQHVENVASDCTMVTTNPDSSNSAQNVDVLSNCKDKCANDCIQGNNIPKETMLDSNACTRDETQEQRETNEIMTDKEVDHSAICVLTNNEQVLAENVDVIPRCNGEENCSNRGNSENNDFADCRQKTMCTVDSNAYTSDESKDLNCYPKNNKFHGNDMCNMPARLKLKNATHQNHKRSKRKSRFIGSANSKTFSNIANQQAVQTCSTQTGLAMKARKNECFVSMDRHMSDSSDDEPLETVRLRVRKDLNKTYSKRGRSGTIDNFNELEHTISISSASDASADENCISNSASPAKQTACQEAKTLSSTEFSSIVPIDTSISQGSIKNFPEDDIKINDENGQLLRNSNPLPPNHERHTSFNPYRRKRKLVNKKILNHQSISEKDNISNISDTAENNKIFNCKTSKLSIDAKNLKTSTPTDRAPRERRKTTPHKYDESSFLDGDYIIEDEEMDAVLKQYPKKKFKFAADRSKSATDKSKSTKEKVKKRKLKNKLNNENNVEKSSQNSKVDAKKESDITSNTDVNVNSEKTSENSEPDRSLSQQKKTGRPPGSKNKVKKLNKYDKSVEKGSLKKLKLNRTMDMMSVKKKRKIEISTNDIGPHGPYLQTKGPKLIPTSCKVVNQWEKDAEQYPSKKSAHFKTNVHSSMLLSNLSSDKSILFPGNIASKEGIWTCALCNAGSSRSCMGDLFGPYFPDIASNPVKLDTDVKAKKKVRRGSKSDPSMKLSGSTGSKSSEVWVHEDCVIWSDGVYLIGSKIYGLDEAVKISALSICSLCKVNGAILGCFYKACSQKYHFVCAVNKGCYMDEENYSVLCPKHKKR